MNTRHWTILALALVCAPALAGTPIEQSRALNAHARVELRNIAGEVNISAWQRDRIRITGTLGKGAKALKISGDRQHLSVTVQAPKRTGWLHWGDRGMRASTLNVQVPAGVLLQVKTVSASIALSGLHGGTLELASISGSVHILADSPQLTVHSVSGNIDAKGRFERAKLVTVSGDILAKTLGKRVHLQTVSGDMRAAGGPFHNASVSTVSGDVELSGAPAANGRIEVQSMSGDVRLNLPRDVSARIRASSFSGSIHSDIASVAAEAHGPGSHLYTTTGDGTGVIHVETFSGDLRLRRR